MIQFTPAINIDPSNQVNHPDPQATQIRRNHMAGIERVREIRRLRTRRKKTAQLVARVKAGTMNKDEAIRKLRKLTPGADDVIAREGWA